MRHDIRPVSQPGQGTALAFETPDRGVGIQGNDQYITQLFRFGQVFYMPAMDQIETSVGEHYYMPFALAVFAYFKKL